MFKSQFLYLFNNFLFNTRAIRRGTPPLYFILRRIKFKFTLTTYLLVGISQRKFIGLENYD